MKTKDDKIRKASINWIDYHSNGGKLSVSEYCQANKKGK